MLKLRELEKSNQKDHAVAMENEERGWKLKRLIEFKKAEPKHELF